MRITKLEDINESNRIKNETCKSCMEDLKGVLSDDQMKKFEEAFHKVTANAILERRKRK